MWIRKSAHSAETIINQISRVVGAIAVVFLVAMMLLTVADVFLRYVFSAPIKGSLELTEFCMVVAGFLGLAWCAVKRGHVKVDLIVSHLPPRAQGITDTITMLLAMTVVPLMAWRAFAQARYILVENFVSPSLNIPEFPFYLVVGIGYVLIFFVIITVLVEFILKALKR